MPSCGGQIANTMRRGPPKSSLEIQIQHFVRGSSLLVVPCNRVLNWPQARDAKVHTIALVAVGITGCVLLCDLPLCRSSAITNLKLLLGPPKRKVAWLINARWRLRTLFVRCWDFEQAQAVTLTTIHDSSAASAPKYYPSASPHAAQEVWMVLIDHGTTASSKIYPKPSPCTSPQKLCIWAL